MSVPLMPQPSIYLDTLASGQDAGDNGVPAPGPSAGTGALTRRNVLALASAVALGAAGCSPAKAPATAKSLDKVTYMTAFGTFGRESYVYVADRKGFFRDAGIEVTIVGGTGQAANVEGLAAGRHQFLSQDSSLVLTVMSKGVKDVRVIGAIHQRTLIAIMALKSAGITQPQDLRNKTLATGGAPPRDMFPAYARLAGFDPSSTKWLMTAPQQVPQLLAAGRVDAVGQFLSGRPLIEAAVQGREIVVFPYGDYLKDLIGNVLVTNTDMIKNKPDLVRRFAGALLKGLAYSLANLEEAGRIMNQAVTTTPAAVAAGELGAMKPYVSIGGSVVGALERSQMSATIALLESVGTIAAGSLTTEQVVDFDFVPRS